MKTKTTVNIDGRLVGDGHPCFIIAEAGANFRISDNPEVNYQHTLKLIDLAVEAKADAVKFQLYRAKKMYSAKAGHADYIGKTKSIYQIIQEMEVPYEWLPKLKNYCDQKGIMFLCTPFDEQSADELEKIDVRAYKIASYTITHLPLLEHIAKKGKPIIFSSGAATHEEIEKAIEVIKKAGNNNIILLQCTAKYPAPLNTINIKTIPLMKEKYNIPVGLSDHSREPIIAPLGAVALGANVIEKHYTTDNSLPGPDHGFALLDKELKVLVSSIRELELALGTADKVIQEEEQELYAFARRTIMATANINEEETFTKENIDVLRPGKEKPGLPPEKIKTVIGRKAKKNICAGAAIQEEDVEW